MRDWVHNKFVNPKPKWFTIEPNWLNKLDWDDDNILFSYPYYGA